MLIGTPSARPAPPVSSWLQWPFLLRATMTARRLPCWAWYAMAGSPAPFRVRNDWPRTVPESSTVSKVNCVTWVVMTSPFAHWLGSGPSRHERARSCRIGSFQAIRAPSVRPADQQQRRRPLLSALISLPADVPSIDEDGRTTHVGASAPSGPLQPGHQPARHPLTDRLRPLTDFGLTRLGDVGPLPP